MGDLAFEYNFTATDSNHVLCSKRTHVRHDSHFHNVAAGSRHHSLTSISQVTYQASRFPFSIPHIIFTVTRMRPSSIPVFFLIAGITSGRVVQHLARPSHGVTFENTGLKTHLLPLNSTITASTEPDHDKPDDKKDEEDRFFTESERETIWNNAVCRGKNLLHAMLLDEIDARDILQWPHVQSVWDGDMKAELQEWGYIEDEEDGTLDRQCDFAGYHQLTGAFRDLGIDTRSAGMGGSNRCYLFAHRDGLAVTRLPDGSLPPASEQYYEVDGRKYRVCTQASGTAPF